MELKQLDKLQEAKRLIGGVKDSMIMMENSSVRETQNSVYYMLENTLEQAAALLEEVSANEITAETETTKKQHREDKV